MNCQETNALLVAYLNEEVSSSERKMVQAHLSGCAACQQELALLSAVQGRVRQSLHKQAAQAVPAPDAWPRLQARLGARPAASLASRNLPVMQRIQSMFTGGTPARRFALTALVVLALLLGTVTVVPSVRAQVREMIDTWFHFRFPGARSSIGLGWGGDASGFRPYVPSWLPEGLDIGLNGGTSEPGAEYVEFEFHPVPRRKGDERFIRLIEGKGEAVSGLPEGREVTINGQPAVFTDKLSARHQVQSDPPTPAGARLIAWYVGEIKMELVSNLPESEMIAVAESMVPMQEGRE